MTENKVKYPARINKVKTKEFSHWNAMRDRCKKDGATQKRFPAYIGCSIDSFFKDPKQGFQNFAEWCQTQKGFGVEGFELDKDILVKGNKVYGPSTCVFVPQQINNLFLVPKRKDPTNNMPVGVRFVDNGYRVEISINNKSVNLGRFPTVAEAEKVYLTEKVKDIHNKADFYKEQIDDRAYKALKSYTYENLKEYYEMIKEQQKLRVIESIISESPVSTVKKNKKPKM